jgi:hypothetical protein
MKRPTDNTGKDVAQPSHKSRLCLAALAKLWRAEPESSLQREDLIEIARAELGKYDLTPDELDEAAPMLAKSLHMRIEQNGAAPLDEPLKQEIERQVLEWCGCIHSPSPAPHSH